MRAYEKSILVDLRVHARMRHTPPGTQYVYDRHLTNEKYLRYLPLYINEDCLTRFNTRG